ncbi:glycoside hydrolase family 71 protein [Rhodococcus sp. IEGM 1409]|uniref:glycoside hydrolase family 71 protein n=1 Tax=Rhodococcus sp. IEGM 1409 TaxID=3047082 RepID=UPI0024B6BCFA|nr:glycoside hydrolase family 71 protein [Rhodococcus sp. IEGM 1409]MDI9898536.1 glycoside hydrolase family 71 protein [Rhodococcus sp. IEGM 1409]
MSAARFIAQSLRRCYLRRTRRVTVDSLEERSDCSASTWGNLFGGIVARLVASAIRTSLALGFVGVLVTASVSGSTAAMAQADRFETTSEVGNTVLPFDVPAPSTLNSKRVFAHYFPPYPISLDNQDPATDTYSQHYLAVNGEGGVHASYGGFLRDRPLPQAPISDPDWKLRNLETEVRQAASEGIDGFSVDIMARSNNTSWWGSSVPLALMQATVNADSDFKIMLMPDMMAEFQTMTPVEAAAEMAVYADYSSAYRLADGRLVISPFAAEQKTPSWWSQFLSVMQSTYGETVAFVPLFVDAASNIDAFASISYGMSSWGERNPNANSLSRTDANAPLVLADRAHDLGKIWMQPVSFQDARPQQGIFDETINTLNLRNTWEIALQSQSEWVQLVTWNDYSEGTSFQPSAGHGFALLDLNSYWLYRFRTGAYPTVVRDTVYLSYRNQPTWATPVNPSSAPMALRPYSPAADNTVEVLSFLTAPADVTITVGGQVTTCHVPAEAFPCVAGLGAGDISVVTSRAGVAVASVNSHVTVSQAPYNQNYDYLMDSSRR